MKIKNVDEAKNYLNKTIEIWVANTENHKIISLANDVKKMESIKGIGFKTKMKNLYVNINQLKGIIKRNEVLKMSTKQLVRDLKIFEKKLNDLETIHGKYVPRISVKRNIKSNTE
jgi:hypothetical protein